VHRTCMSSTDKRYSIVRILGVFMFIFAECHLNGVTSKYTVGLNFTDNVVHYIKDIVTSILHT